MLDRTSISEKKCSVIRNHGRRVLQTKEKRDSQACYQASISGDSSVSLINVAGGVSYFLILHKVF